ncbi:hypothetical protein OIU79_013182 [Salix purpurea]|uniref:Uncharacterized protein n=1 Tax=Salix purpurea TaxID=77065 RepID=A0A9Q0Q4V0_SALPP|nr:hypothetical protein OIU79_013182 [Salix purpurea]
MVTQKAGKSKTTHPVQKFHYLDHNLEAHFTDPAAT